MSVDMPATRISREDGFLPVCEAEADCASSSPSCALSAGRSFVPGPARGATPARRDGAAVAKHHSGAGEDCAYRTFGPRVNLP